MIAVATAAVALDSIDPWLLRYVVVLLVGLALGYTLCWATTAQELRAMRSTVRRTARIIALLDETRRGGG